MFVCEISFAINSFHSTAYYFITHALKEGSESDSTRIPDPVGHNPLLSQKLTKNLFPNDPEIGQTDAEFESKVDFST